MFLRRLRTGWTDDDVGTVDMIRQTGQLQELHMALAEGFAAEGFKGCCATRRGPRVLRLSGPKPAERGSDNAVKGIGRRAGIMKYIAAYAILDISPTNKVNIPLT
ncbi:hypothetical protein GCM10007880_66090 [Mesorhizobium amorphae]|nr:hypothetical protein GCM10007880_66090 [Mesorhizobium amorphae]